MSALKRRVRRLDQPTGTALSIVVRSLPGDTPENIERMLAQATNGDATAEILHIKRVAV
jgi:hypothetical protein